MPPVVAGAAAVAPNGAAPAPAAGAAGVELNEKGAGLSPPAKENEPNGAAAIDPLAGAEAVGSDAVVAESGEAEEAGVTREPKFAGASSVLPKPSLGRPLEALVKVNAVWSGATLGARFWSSSSAPK